MITGEVTADREAIIKIIVRGPNGEEEEVAAVLDTGFTEYLTLPPAAVATLNLRYQYSLPLFLADNRQVSAPVYDAAVLWNGQARSVPVQAMDGDTLLGMSMFYGLRLLLDNVDGGPVTIGDIP